MKPNKTEEQTEQEEQAEQTRKQTEPCYICAECDRGYTPADVHILVRRANDETLLDEVYLCAACADQRRIVDLDFFDLDGL